MTLIACSNFRTQCLFYLLCKLFFFMEPLSKPGQLLIYQSIVFRFKIIRIYGSLSYPLSWAHSTEWPLKVSTRSTIVWIDKDCWRLSDIFVYTRSINYSFVDLFTESCETLITKRTLLLSPFEPWIQIDLRWVWTHFIGIFDSFSFTVIWIILMFARLYTELPRLKLKSLVTHYCVKLYIWFELIIRIMN